MTLRSTYTYVVMEVSNALFQEVRQKLIAAGYQQALHDSSEFQLVLDMHGIALANADRDADSAAAPTKSLADWLRDSLRTGLLFGCPDEPLDDAGKRVVRSIVDRLDQASEDRRSARNGVLTEVLDIIKKFDDLSRAEYDNGLSKLIGYVNTSSIYTAVAALREDHDEEEDPPHTGDDEIIDAASAALSGLEDLIDDLKTEGGDEVDVTAIGDHAQGALDDLNKVYAFVLRARGYPVAARRVEQGDV